MLGDIFRMRLRLGQPGAARPREVVAAVLGRASDPMLDVPLRKTRTVLAGSAGSAGTQTRGPDRPA